MPSSAVRSFSDPDEYAASIRQGTVELTVTERGWFDAKLIRIDLDRLWMQRFTESTARVLHVAGWGGRSAVAFLSEPGPGVLWAGAEMGAGDVLRLGDDQSYHHRISGPSAFATMSLPIEDMVSLGAETAGLDLAPLLAVLPGAFGNEPEALPDAAPHAFGAPRAAPGCGG